MLLSLTLVVSLALADKQACAHFGEQLFDPSPARAVLEQAFHHCRALAEAGDAEAQYYLASVFLFRNPPNNPNVEMWMKRSSDNGYGRAQFYMATVYRHSGVAAHAVALYEKAAANGIPPAPLELARMYEQGAVIALDAKKAVYWYEYAAKHYRLSNAVQALSRLYSEGMPGLPKDPAKAQYWKELLRP